MLKKLFTSPKRRWWVFYLPILPYYIYLSMRSGSFSFPTACNPAMLAGGMVNESKFQHLSDLDEAFRPITIFIPAGAPANNVLQLIGASSLNYPFILKPDRGEKGWGVQLIHSEEELLHWIRTNDTDAVAQQYIDLPLELGIVFYRYPDGKKWGISSVGIKQLPAVTGDGASTVEQLILQTGSAINGYGLTTDLQHIPSKGEKVTLDFVAHRRRGTKFIDANEIADPQLAATIERITRPVKGFDIGRLDIRTSSIENLREGKDCHVLEINGAGSLPIHVFDPRVSFFAAYRDLYKHWTLIYRISKQNHALGTPFMSWKEFVRQLKLAGNLPRQFNQDKNNTA
ncbi:hypothetical protein HHL16_07550 [Pseudoflavitalea sp. G-6-1-2]|uniref:hypothetical protein n=1 Tax=Pseudoflavitalea sp. G-6-1-2 TaxID=2728841 RepID=UPI00146BE5D7|nr:hypothetical protein [Pseudoflavitalea sp. G-6-1-2]NML20723.1 hypothetical protein [Pseudoflavitalea sp. G-6-1-2]